MRRCFKEITMYALKKFIHGLVMMVLPKLAGLLPDKVPVTFVGVDSTRELTESIAHTGAQRVLIVTDAVLVEIGVVERVTECLRASGVSWSTYSEVLPDPTTQHVQAGLAILKRDGCDSVLAVGGGSPMDTSKIIAALATNDVEISKLEGMMKVRRAPAPLFAIPTTAGTGSEATIAAVVSDPVTHTKGFFTDPKLLPVMVALDPSLMLGLPPAITAATGMDALTHAVESHLCLTSTPETERYARIAIPLVFNHLPTACTDGGNIEARRAMCLASYYAGLAFTRTSVGYVHAIAHTFGAYYRTPHGLANAIALPEVLEFSKDRVQKQLASLADLIGLDGANEREKADAFIRAVRELMTKIDIPSTLDALVVDDIPKIAKQALDEAHLNYPVPRYMKQEECEALIAKLAA